MSISNANTSAANINRFQYTATGGETSISGVDSNGATISYIIGKEQVFVNGVLLERTADYTATDGATIALSNALVAGDILEIIAFSAFTVSTAVSAATVANKGDLLVGTSAATVTNLPVGADGSTLVANSSAGGGVSWTSYGSPNFAINGGFDVWQRGTSVAHIGAGGYLADRWGVNQYQDCRMQRIALGYQNANLNLPYAIRCSSSTTSEVSGGTRMRLNQTIESVNSYLLAGKTVTLSFWVRFSAATISSSTGIAYGDWNANFWYYTSTTDGPTSSTGPDSTGSSYPITNGSFPTTWTKVTYTGTVPTNVNNVGVVFGFANTGSTASADSAYYDIAQVQLEIGSVATPFRRSGGTLQGELAACQRYLPAINAGGKVLGVASSTTQSYIYPTFPVSSRVPPTGITISALSNYIITSAALGTGTPTAITFSTASVDGAQIGVANSAGSPTIAAGQGDWLYIGATTILFTGCEL